jgi:LysR family transcriptional regulator, regulator for bpeEF and oprC
MDQLLALRVFVRIADSGTFSKAADSMNIPRPTVTKLVQDLERHLGTKLLQRTTRRVNVTPEGAAYYERATRLIADLQEMDESVARAKAQPRGRIRVDVGSSIASMILIPALPAFCARYPDLHVELGVSDRSVDLIGEGVDCVIRGGELADSSLVSRRLANLAWVTCASPRYLRARGVPKHPSDLLSGHAIAGYFSSLTAKAVPLELRRGEERAVVQAQPLVAVNESTAHINALLAGLGIGQTFRFMAAPHIAQGRLRSVLDEWTRPAQPLQLLYPSSRHLSAKLRVFADWAVEIFGALGEP